MIKPRRKVPKRCGRMSPLELKHIWTVTSVTRTFIWCPSFMCFLKFESNLVCYSLFCEVSSMMRGCWSPTLKIKLETVAKKIYHLRKAEPVYQALQFRPETNSLSLKFSSCFATITYNEGWWMKLVIRRIFIILHAFNRWISVWRSFFVILCYRMRQDCDVSF
jgi:hypothetical protein